MKVLVISNFFPPHVIGGAEIIAHHQAKALADRGHDVRVLAGDNSHGLPGYPIQTEVFDGLPITRVSLTQRDFAPTGNNVSHPGVERIFLKLIAGWKPDVIHAHHMAGLSLGILQLARANGIRIALTLHDHWGFCMNSTRITTQNTLCNDSTQCHSCHANIHDDDVQLPQRMRQDYLRWQLDAVDYFISPSRYLAGQYILNGIPAERMHVIANGIDLERFINTAPPEPGERLNILFTGYMGGHKGVPTLLEAVALLPQEKVHLDMVGDGHMLASYIASIEKNAPNISVKFWGRLPNASIAERFAEAHVFVLPSVCPENQPVTITEAMACGLPVVASRIGGISELVDEGHTGWLAEPGAAADLAARLGYYIDNPEQIVAHGKASRERIQAFAFGLQIERIEALLSSPVTERSESLRLIACYGAPLDATFSTVLEEVAPVPANRPQPVTQPCFIPVNWIKPEAAELLWVSDAVTNDPDTALQHIAAYRELEKPVVLDERNIFVARHSETSLLVRGKNQTALGLKILANLPKASIV
ncbi:glycosyltransferase family 4 protein [Pseudomonas sp. UMAB-08]|uniref:glycosyltransferase family 4 protein n=1 Tax=Pseudomonas sp. UMAB-08 TaxID=1365375 RepID=UPI001C56A008|nr:glycosyltransferase family 4 protein [Pseudomonas sp. UMAB-08]